MKLHPAEIAKEIKNFPFFKSFNDELLLQISAMVHLEKFNAGQFILREGEKNNSLIFLRSGTVEISLGGEILTTLEKSGEVLGEMSVITGNLISTTVKAITDCDCFMIKTENFEHVHPKDADKFQALLYKIYCHILTERLTKSNEKARLFEILNRELHEAQNAIEEGNGGRVLLVEPDKKQQLPIRMALGGTGVHLEIASDLESAREILKNEQFDIVISEDTCIQILKELHDRKAPAHLVLLTNKDILGNINILKDNRFVEHIISRDSEDRASTIRHVLTALGKLLNRDIFGLEKYLPWGVDIQKKTVVHSAQREDLRNEMCTHLKKIGVRSTVIDRVNTVAEELLMNAIYDAPVDPQGKPIFNHLTRKQEIALESHQQSILRYASDGMTLAISVTDPFGSLGKELVVDYQNSCYEGEAGSMNEHKGGAGRGLHQIVENSDLTVFNVKKGVRTEVICIFNLDGQKRESQHSFHYFFI